MSGHNAEFFSFSFVDAVGDGEERVGSARVDVVG